MVERFISKEFAEAIFSQIQSFGEYGFPESHAASFVLLTYASSWLKCHEPAAFLCALLNSQPMGFYSPSQLVQDARRQGVEVRPCDVGVSGWESALEDAPGPPGQPGQPAVRIGMSLLALAGNRRQALWQAAGAVPDKDLLRPTTPDEAQPLLQPPSEGDEIVGDYRAQGLTLGRHPLALLRPQLLERRFMSAATLAGYQDGQLARACGIVTVRQRPGTAKGVLFMTLEDETGTVNVIVWPALVEQQRREVLGAPLLGVYGVWQREGIVRHLVAKRLVDMSRLLGRLPTSSRDFC